MANQHDRKIWTLAEAVRVLENPDATPADVMAAKNWNCITPRAARDWCKGFNAGLRANGAEPVQLDRVA